MQPSRDANSAWRKIERSDYGLSTALSEELSRSESASSTRIGAIRRAPTLLIFSDYGGSHKDARFEVFSFLATTPVGIARFESQRQQLRQDRLGRERRMAYKALNDGIRRHALPEFLRATDEINGLLINFAVDKQSLHRLREDYPTSPAFGDIGPWASRSFGKLACVGHLGALLVEGLRTDHQDVLWISDEDEIAPNLEKHAEATRVIGHLLNSYCTSQIGHFRFGTTSSDPGDLSIEDLAAVPDLAAGCLTDVLTELQPNPAASSVNRLHIPPEGTAPFKLRRIAAWLGEASSPLGKINLVIDEGEEGCAVRSFTMVTDLAEL
jgi:hypothetical protein